MLQDDNLSNQLLKPSDLNIADLKSCVKYVISKSKILWLSSIQKWYRKSLDIQKEVQTGISHIIIKPQPFVPPENIHSTFASSRKLVESFPVLFSFIS